MGRPDPQAEGAGRVILKRLDHNLSHKWHVAINRFHNGKIGTPDWRGWMYEAKMLADEVPRMVKLFKAEREKTLPVLHRQCSHSPEEPVQNNHLRCCLGVECQACPELLALDKIEHCAPEQIDQAKSWTCAAHILSEGGDRAGEGYLLTVDDRMFWDRVYESMSGDEQEATAMSERERAEEFIKQLRNDVSLLDDLPDKGWAAVKVSDLIKAVEAFAREERARGLRRARALLIEAEDFDLYLDSLSVEIEHLREEGGHDVDQGPSR